MKQNIAPWLVCTCLLACGSSSKSQGQPPGSGTGGGAGMGGVGGTAAHGGSGGSGAVGGAAATAGSGGTGGSDGESGGTGGSGGDGASGGTGGTAANGGTGGTAANGGTGGTAASGGTGMSGGGHGGTGMSTGGSGPAGAAGASKGGSGGALGGSGGTGGSIGVGGGHTTCQDDTDCQGFKCCDKLCVNVMNDVHNCGSCGVACNGAHPYCANGTCGTPPCSGNTCDGGATCCGTQCCSAGKLCCTVNMIQQVTGCFDPVDGTCPTGCASCVCADPATPIATPEGERRIAELQVGDLVYSVDHGRVVVVPLVEVHRQAVTPEHGMIELRLESGRTLRMSYGHPAADGRAFGEFGAGDFIDGVRVLEKRAVSYEQPFTYDILPASDSGTYFAAGVLVGSTLAAHSSSSLLSLPASAPVSSSPR